MEKRISCVTEPSSSEVLFTGSSSLDVSVSFCHSIFLYVDESQGWSSYHCHSSVLPVTFHCSCLPNLFMEMLAYVIPCMWLNTKESILWTVLLVLCSYEMTIYDLRCGCLYHCCHLHNYSDVIRGYWHCNVSYVSLHIQYTGIKYCSIKWW